MRSTTVSAVVLVGALLSGSALAQTEPRRTDTEAVQNFKVARATYEKARKYFEKRDLEKAVKEVEGCLARMPDFSDAHFLLAKIAYLEKRYAEALPHMERAESSFEASNAMYAEAQGDRVRELERLRDQQNVKLDDLRDALSRATTDDQRRAIEIQIDQVEHTRNELQREIYEPPTKVAGIPADYHFFHGNILLRLNRLDDAALQYREALRIKPNHADASNNLASLYLSAGHAQVAKEILDQAEANGVTVNADLKQAVLNAIK
jgi:tetratricopeptide (TPR) repeat protein